MGTRGEEGKRAARRWIGGGFGVFGSQKGPYMNGWEPRIAYALSNEHWREARPGERRPRVGLTRFLKVTAGAAKESSGKGEGAGKSK